MKIRLSAIFFIAVMLFALCSCSGEKAPAECEVHDFYEETIVRNSTCSEEGVAERICKVCGAKETRTIPTLSHSYSSWIKVEDATCVSDGTEERTCYNCGHKETRAVKATGNHSYGSWTTVKKATCSEEGVSERTCHNCSRKETKKISATGHKWIAATLTTPKTCSVCGMTDGKALGLSKDDIDIRLIIPSVGTTNYYASVKITNKSDNPIFIPTNFYSFNGYLCTCHYTNSGSAFELAPNHHIKLDAYRSMIWSNRLDAKYRDMYLDNNSKGYVVIDYMGKQYYAEYGVDGITYFRPGNVNG